MKLGQSYLGFVDTNTMQGGRKAATLDKDFMLESVYYSHFKDLILKCVLKGLKAEKQENYQTYKRDGELTQPKTVYRMYVNEENHFFDINKTQYDFAMYLIENEFTEEKAKQFIEKEEILLKQKEKLIEAERLKELDCKKKEEEKRKASVIARQMEWIEKGKEICLTETENKLKELDKKYEGQIPENACLRQGYLLLGNLPALEMQLKIKCDHIKENRQRNEISYQVTDIVLDMFKLDYSLTNLKLIKQLKSEYEKELNVAIF